jgi:hypothetical protein
MAERESTSMVMAAWGQVISAGVGIVAAVVAAWVGWMSIQQNEEQGREARTQRALEFFATFNSPSMLTTRELLENEDWCARYHYRPPLLPDYQSPATSSHIVSIIDFFDLVDNSCGPGKVCDREFAEQLFSPYAARLYDNLSKEIHDQRDRRGERFGQGMANLAHSDAQLAEVMETYARDECHYTGATAAPPG